MPTTPTRLADALREIERLRGTLKVIAVWAAVSAKDHANDRVTASEFLAIEEKAMAALRGEGKK